MGCSFYLSPLHLQSHFIAITHQEVELEAREQAHNNECDHCVGRTCNWRIVPDRMGCQCATGDEGNIWLGLIETRDGEEGETCYVNEQAGADDQPHPHTTKILFANDCKLTTGNAGPDSGNQ